MNLRQLKALGFDDSYRISKGRYSVECTRCICVTINGHSIALTTKGRALAQQCDAVLAKKGA
jgi:hypothetical protein